MLSVLGKRNGEGEWSWDTRSGLVPFSKQHSHSVNLFLYQGQSGKPWGGCEAGRGGASGGGRQGRPRRSGDPGQGQGFRRVEGRAQARRGKQKEYGIIVEWRIFNWVMCRGDKKLTAAVWKSCAFIMNMGLMYSVVNSNNAWLGKPDCNGVMRSQVTKLVLDCFIRKKLSIERSLSLLLTPVTSYWVSS